MTSYYLPSCSKIGVGYQVHELANAMVRRGHQVTVYSACSASEGSLYETRTLFLTGSLRTFRFANEVRQVDLSQYDVLHSHGDDYLRSSRRTPPTVRTLHGSCFAEAVHIRGAKERVRMVALGVGESVSSLRAQRAVCVSPATRRWAPWIREVIPNGVDQSRFRPAGSRTPAPTILFVGTYRRRKRGWLLAKAFREVIRPRLKEACLVMVCEDADPEPGIQVLGRVSDAELINLYQTAWVFCLPSQYEGFGIPYAEALSCGTPVVATPNAGSRFVLGDGEYGELCQPESLGDTLLALLQDPGRRQRLSELGLVRAREFSMDRVSEAYERIYESILATGPVQPKEMS
jgi:phosphatidyl-myo-inositol alpha-mannosyltransferase